MIFQKFSIQLQLSIGFALILLLAATSTYITSKALSDSALGFEKYNDMVHQSNLMGDIEANLLLIRTSAKDYFIGSREEDVALFDEHYERLSHDLNEAKGAITNTDNRRNIQVVETDLEHYVKKFKQVVFLSRSKGNLINEQLNVIGPRITFELSQLLTIIYAMEPSQRSFDLAKEVSVLNDNFLLGRVNALKFFDTHNAEHFHLAKDYFSIAQEVLNNHTATEGESALNKIYLQIAGNIEDYENNLEQLYKLSAERVKSIHLLDEKGPAMAKLSRAIKHNIIMMQNELGPAHVKSNDQAFSWVMATLFALISVTIIIAISIPKQVIDGLTSLKKGVSSFLIFLNKEALDVELIEIEGNNEFSDIAKSLNENILLTKEKLLHVQALEEEHRQNLEALAITDGLTQLYNRRYFDEVALTLYSDAYRHKHSFIIFILDIDNFKLYNDNYGHSAGDTALVEVARALKRYMARSSDLVFRLGGEEFGGIITSEADHIEHDIEHIKNVTKKIESLRIPHAYNTASDYITASIGIRWLSAADYTTFSVEQAYQDADSALYLAKQEGRNTARLFDSETPKK